MALYKLFLLSSVMDHEALTVDNPLRLRSAWQICFVACSDEADRLMRRVAQAEIHFIRLGHGS